MNGGPTDPPIPARRHVDRALGGRREPGARPDVPSRAAVEARSRLARMREGREPFDLVVASLLVAAEEYPDLDTLGAVGRLDAIGAEAKRRLSASANPFARLDALRVLLFEEIGFRGNSQDYDDPKNSFLNDVLERKLGIPLTLSIVYLEVATRAGLKAKGVALPGHFVVRVDEGSRRILVDPFHRGTVITEEDCRDLVTRTTGRPALFRREQLEGTGSVAMIARLFLNLKRIYLSRGDYGKALATIERLLILSPSEPREIRDRGLLLAHLGKPGAAVSDLESYLAMVPGAADADSVRGRLAWLLRRMTEGRLEN